MEVIGRQFDRGRQARRAYRRHDCAIVADAEESWSIYRGVILDVGHGGALFRVLSCEGVRLTPLLPQAGSPMRLRIAFGPNASLRITAEVVWTKERYLMGLRFLQPLNPAALSLVTRLPHGGEQ
jgi:hypothetical protein